MATKKPSPDTLATGDPFVPRPLEPDVPLGAVFAPELSATPELPEDGAEAVNAGFDVPTSPVMSTAETLALTDRILAQTRSSRVPVASEPEVQQQRQTRAIEDESIRRTTPVGRNYANEAFIEDHVDGEEKVIDMMQGTAPGFHLEVIPENVFREFKDRESYEAFMREPVVIKFAESRDKNEPPLIFVGVNGAQRWCPRNKPIRLPRYFIERLAQAQEMRFETLPTNDDTIDNRMVTKRHSAASYSFSILHDPNPSGRRWLQRVTREGT